VPGISPDTILELYCIVTRRGFEPITVPRFPDNLIAQQAHLAAVQKLTVRGILEKDKSLILQALVLHPFTTSIPRAKALFEAMWEEEKDVLGSYWDGV
jgi:alpha-galactosidase/6-phospho-beta-glucosidase family protein